MTIRQFAKSINYTVVGKLTRKMGRYVESNGIVEHWQFWEDEAGNVYDKDENGWFIMTKEGVFIDGVA